MLNKSIQTSTLSPLKQKSRLSLLGLASVFTLTLGLGVESAMAVREATVRIEPRGIVPRGVSQPSGTIYLSGNAVGTHNGQTVKSPPAAAIKGVTYDGWDPYTKADISVRSFQGDAVDTLLKDVWLLNLYTQAHARRVRAGDNITVDFTYRYRNETGDRQLSACSSVVTITETDLNETNTLGNAIMSAVPTYWSMNSNSNCITTAPPSADSEKKENK